MRPILTNLSPWATPLAPPTAHLWERGWALLAAAMTDAMDDDDDEDDREDADEPDEDDGDGDCRSCGGSGGGSEEHLVCWSCGGSGVDPAVRAARRQDREAEEADRAWDRLKDERAERGGR